MSNSEALAASTEAERAVDHHCRTLKSAYREIARELHELVGSDAWESLHGNARPAFARRVKGAIAKAAAHCQKISEQEIRPLLDQVLEEAELRKGARGGKG